MEILYYGMGLIDTFSNWFKPMQKSEPDVRVEKIYLSARSDVGSTPSAPAINQVIDVFELYRSKYMNYSYAQMSRLTPIVRNIQNTIVLDCFKNGFYITSDYACKCKSCEKEYVNEVSECEVCGGTDFIMPNDDNKVRLENFVKSCNRNGYPLKKVLKSALLDATRYDEFYLLKYYIYELDENRNLTKTLQYLDKADPTLIHPVMSRDGTLGVSLQGYVAGFCPVHRETELPLNKVVCPKCGTPLLTADYYADYGEGKQTKIYYSRDELIRFSMFEMNSNLSMIETLGNKITSLNAIDQLINDIYVSRKVPNRALFFKTNDIKSIIESDEYNADKLKGDKNYTPKYAITSDAAGEFVQVVDMLGTIDEMKLMDLSDKYEKDIASCYQATIDDASRTITINSDLIKDLQDGFNFILQDVVACLGVTDWQLTLKPNRTEDEANELRLEGLKIQNATGRANLGFEITGYDEERKEYLFESSPSGKVGQMNFSSFSSNSRGLEDTFGNLPGTKEMSDKPKE
jgi:hypothetical protein